LYERLPQILSPELGYAMSAVWLREGEGLALKTSSNGELPAEEALQETGPRQAVQTGQAVQLFGDVERQAQSVTAVPLSVGGEVRGALSVYSQEANAFQELDRLLLEIVAAQAGSVLERLEVEIAYEIKDTGI
jgi:GAF domain-containing protein